MAESQLYCFARRGLSLVPADEDAESLIRKLGEGEIILIRPKRARNPKHHRKYWGMVRLVFRNQEKFPTIRHLHVAIKIAAGWYEDVPISIDGRLVYLPLSISWEDMDQDEFERYYAEAVSATVRLLPQFSAQWLEEYVLSFGH